MEEIKVGEYVRTMDGKIGIFDRYSSRPDTSYFKSPFNCFIKLKNRKTPLQCCREYIIKHSSNIINLIEEGDYVNGTDVITVYGYDEDGNDKDGLGICETDEDYAYYKYLEDINIYSIVTHEQFANIEYRIEDR